jgi:hypothetical protein
MRRFWNKLFGDCRSTKAPRTARRPPRRASLQVEGLEDRMVLTSANFFPSTSTLVINASPGSFGISDPSLGIFIPPAVRQITFQADPHQAKLQVLDDGVLVPVFENGVPVPGGEVPIASIREVDVNLALLDAVHVDDSNGVPFAQGATIKLLNSGSSDSLNLTGSRTIQGGESYVVGGTAATGSTLSLGGSTFQFSGIIGSVTDSVQITGNLQVSTAGPNVSLSGSDGVWQALSGIGPGAGGNLFYSNKPGVEVNEFAPGASVTLGATAAAAGETAFGLVMLAANDRATIAATPSTVRTSVRAEGNTDFVYLEGNSGAVSVQGNSSTYATLSTVAPLGTDVGGRTSGIQQNVVINGVNTLALDDSGNHTTPEHVTVTEATISGTGLFGNPAAVVHYSNTGHVEIFTGTAPDTYAVHGSRAGAHFGSSLEIDDNFENGLNVAVALDAGSGLHLHLVAFYTTIFVSSHSAPSVQPPAALSLFGLHGTYSQPIPNLPDGDETVTFAGGLTSDVSYQGFTSVALENPNGTGPSL